MGDSQAETKQSLRKMDFPLSSKEALNKISNLICARAPSIKQMDLALDLMSEFVFCEVDRRGNKKPPFTPIQELQLLEVLYDALNETPSDASRNSIFLTLFSGTTATQRLGILGKLVSIALSSNAFKILNSASTWMQQLGNTSTNSCKLAENLVIDYFILLPRCVENIQDVPSNAPQFAANFMTAIAELYFNNVNSNELKAQQYPNDCLLEAVTLWIAGNHKLCIAAQLIQSPLPPGAIAMEATTPIAGLLKWTILAPLHAVDSDLYAQLHLGILHSLLEIPVSSTPRAISAAQLGQVNGAILKHRVKDEDKSDALQLSLDRYAQAVQVALAMRCIYGNIDELINQLSYLPSNQLMQIVIAGYKSSK